MTRANKAGPEHFPYKDDAIAVQKQQPRAGSVRMCWPPVHPIHRQARIHAKPRG